MARSDSSRKAAILKAAIGVFAEYGLKGATTRRLAGAAGVNSALLYYYFEDKKNLFAAAIETVMRSFVARLREATFASKGGAESLQQLVEVTFDFFDSHPEQMRLIQKAIMLYPDVMGKALNGMLSKDVPAPIVVLAEGMKKGELVPMHPVLAWWCIMGMCSFSLQMEDVLAHVDKTRIPGSPPPMEQRKAAIVRIVMSGLAKGGKKS